MVDRESLTELLDTHFEWLAVREDGRSVPLRRDEIEIGGGERVLLGIVLEDGYRSLHIRAFEPDGREFYLEIAGPFGKELERLRFIPREPASALSESIELARAERANAIAKLVAGILQGWRLVKISLSEGNGRVAQILLKDAAGSRIAVAADVTGKMTHESLLAYSLNWLSRLRKTVKQPVERLFIAAEAKQARNLRKLTALIDTRIQEAPGLIRLSSPAEEPGAALLGRLEMAGLWRERPQKLKLPESLDASETAARIMAHAPEKIDIVHSKNGETLRFHGLPFLRIRRVFDKERAWFGLGAQRTLLTEDTQEGFDRLLDELHRYRDPEAEYKQHFMFRLAPEAWLESVLKRNIALLDPNLVLSPIYNQFRSSTDKIDLLALRKDGRLVIIELKTEPDRDTVFQAADYWRKIELQRRRGILANADLFGGREIADVPTLVYVAAPALCFHKDFETFANMIDPEVEIWRWELHNEWRKKIRVVARVNYTGAY